MSLVIIKKVFLLKIGSLKEKIKACQNILLVSHQNKQLIKLEQEKALIILQVINILISWIQVQWTDKIKKIYSKPF